MKKAKTKKRISRKQRELAVLQVREYNERYDPELRDGAVDISPCGRFASARKVSPDDPR
jgi:hypothetical protein